MPESSNLPRRLLSLVKDRSPSKTWIRTVGWLSAAVEKLCRLSARRIYLQEQKRSHLRLASGNDCVAGNEFGEDTTGGLNAECQRTDINEDDIFSTLLTREDATLDGSTISNSLIGVDTLRRLFSKILL
jgi:hypothetical protein